MRAALLVLAACAAAPPAPTPVAPAPVAPASAHNAASPRTAVPPPNVKGRVLLDGAPIEYFGVAYTQDFSSPSMAPPFEIRAADGRFGISIPPGTWDLIIVAPGAARHVLPGIDVRGVVDLGTIALDHGHTVTGYVLDADGAPVPNAWVELRNRSSVERNATPLQILANGNLSARTGKDGHYVLRGQKRGALEMGHAQLLAITTDGRASLPLTAPDADTSINLEVLPTATLIVSVTGGHPLGVTASVGSSRLIAREEADGQYHFDHLPQGTYQLGAVGSGVASQSITVHAGAVEAATLTLSGLPPVAVEVTSKTECKAIQLRDLANVEVEIAPCNARVASFPKLYSGVYLACPDKRRCSPINVTAQPAQQQIELRE